MEAEEKWDLKGVKERTRDQSGAITRVPECGARKGGGRVWVERRSRGKRWK